MSTDTTTEPRNAGVQLAASRHSARSYARSVIKRWPALSEEQRAEVREILAPIVNRTALLASNGGGRSDG